jgi:hypothetical protein
VEWQKETTKLGILLRRRRRRYNCCDKNKKMIVFMMITVLVLVRQSMIDDGPASHGHQGVLPGRRSSSCEVLRKTPVPATLLLLL